MAERTILIKVGANITGYMSALRTMATATKDTAGQASTWMTKHKDGLNEVSTGLLKTGAIVTGFTALAVKRFADFDAAMSSVGAATMESAENMGLLRQAALDAGADTQYSATQAAGAIEALAKAGVQTSDILRGGLTGALNLAASAQMDVGQAAEIAATTMNQFGLKGKDASHIADLLAASAGKAMGDVTDMAGALKFVGPVAKQMGVSLEQTAGTIAYLAQQGVLGEQAGTSLRGILASLTSPSKVAAREMENLGINVYDASGQFVGFNGVAEQMKKSMAGLTAAERDEAFGRIFGNEQITTARLLYQGGAKAIDDWTSSVNDSGYAAEQARIKTDNLKGDIERLGGSLDTALIQSGSGANDVLRQLAQSAEAVVDRVGQLPEPVLQATTLLAGAGGLAVLGIGGMGKLATSLNNAKVAVEGLGISLKTAGIAAGGVGAALAIGTFYMAQWAEAAAESKQNTEDFASTLDQATGAVTDATREMAAQKVAQTEAARIYKNMGGDVTDLTDAVLGNADAIARVNELLDKQPKEKFLWTESDLAGVARVRSDIKGLGTDLEDSHNKWELQREAMENTTAATSETATAIEKYAAAQQDGTETTQDYTDALKELVDAQREAAGVVLSEREAQRQFEESIRDVSQSLKDNGTSLDIATEAGSRNQAALDAVADAGWNLIDSMRANGATQEDLQATMQTTRDRFIGVAQQMGLSADQATALADELGLIPRNVSVQVAADTTTARQDVERLVSALNNRVATIQVRANMPDLNGAVSGTGRMGTFATGGPVHGPGTGTSDSIPAYLSNGEYVIKAAAVARYGRAHFDQLNAMRFADGGQVQRGRYVTTQYTPMPAQAAPVQAGPTVVYVQNPWGPGYMQAQVDGRVQAGIAQQQRTFSGSRGSRA